MVVITSHPVCITDSMATSIHMLVRKAFTDTRSFSKTVAMLSMLRPNEFLLMRPWLILRHCLAMGIDAVIAFGWVSLQGQRRCRPHVWVETEEGVLDPFMSLVVGDLVYHDDVPPGYDDGVADSRLQRLREIYEDGFENHLDQLIKFHYTQTMVLVLDELSNMLRHLDIHAFFL